MALPGVCVTVVVAVVLVVVFAGVVVVVLAVVVAVVTTGVVAVVVATVVVAVVVAVVTAVVVVVEVDAVLTRANGVPSNWAGDGAVLGVAPTPGAIETSTNPLATLTVQFEAATHPPEAEL